MVSLKQHQKERRLLVQTVIFALVIILITIVSLFSIYQQQVLIETSVINQQEQINVDVVKEIIKHDFKAAIQDLIRLSETKETLSILNGRDSSKIETVMNKLIDIVEWHNIYLEARVLDRTGLELISIDNRNGKTTIKTSENLQDQSDRYYFKETMALKRGEVYISPFDLNINYGKIEIPYMPVIRLAVPVFDEGDTAQGIVILNYKGNGILEEIDKANKSSLGKLVLLNSEGFFLKGFNSEDEWGFQIEERKDRKFQNIFSDNWDEITTKRNGKIQTKKGHFIFDTINLKNEASFILLDLPITKSYNISNGKEKDLFLVAYLSQDSIQGILKNKLGNIPLYLTLIGFGIIFAIIIISIIICYYRLRLLKSLAALEKSERTYRTLTNISPVGIFHTTSNGIYEYVNQRWCDITGMSSEEVLGTDGTSPLHPDYRDLVLEQWQLLIKKGNTFSFQFPLQKGNKQIWVLGAAVKERDENGLHGGFIGTLTDISKQKNIEQQLSYDKIKYSSVLDLAADAIITINESGIITEFNGTAQRYFGYKLDEIIGKNVMVLAPEPHRSLHQGYIENYLNTGIAKIIGYPREITAVKKDGTIFPMELSVGEVLFEGQRLFTGIIRDISMRKEAERQLLESEQFANATLDALNASVVIVNQFGIIIGVNKSWRNILKENNKANKENYEGASYFDVMKETPVIAHEDAECFIEGIQDVLSGKMDIFKKEYPFQSLNTKGWFDGSVTRFVRDNEIFAVISHENITDRVLAEEKLRQFKTTLDQTQDAVFIFDAYSLRFIYANHGAIKQLGYTFEELKEKSPVDILKEYTELSYREMIFPFRKSGLNSLSFEMIYLRKDGSQFPADVRMQYVEEGKDSSYVVIARDISEQKRINLELEHARIAAEQAAITKSEFLANMSHEIRTPMNAIIGMTYLALQTKLTDQQKDYLQKINTASKALLGIINDILDFSKIEAGKLTLEKIPISLSGIIDDMFNLLSKNIEEKGLELLIDVDSNIPDGLIGDPIRIGQIFTNLLNNAVKFTEKGEIDIHIRMLTDISDTITLECSVSDTGIGMSKKQTENLFQKFNQADSSTTRKYGGTGLGLTISKQLIELMGGTITVESEQGKGTTFIFSINLDIQKNSISENPKIIPRNIRDLKGLLIGNSMNAVSLMEKQLNDLTIRVESSVGCNQASKLLESAFINKDPFELIIIDYALMKSGCNIFEKLKQDSNLALIPLIIISSSKNLNKARDFFENRNLCSVLKKPVTNSSIYDAILNVFGHKALQITRNSDYQTDDKELLANIYNSNILLVEDNKINQQVASELLNRANVNVTIAENGKEALEKVKKYSFDLILMDIQMPVMDGIEATKKIRKLKHPIGKIPIIAMTAHAMIGDKQKSLVAGVDDYLTKPIDPKEFYSCLSRWLKPKLNNKKTIKTNKKNIHEDFPDKIIGIDLPTALNRVAGNKTLYINLLRDFIRENEDFPEQLTAALKELDNSTAKRLVHTLKGVSGNLGADILRQKAEKLEDAIINHTENTQDLLKETAESLAILIKEIRRSIRTENQLIDDIHNINEEIPDPIARISKFRETLEMRDMESIDLFNELRTYFSLKYPKILDQLSRNLDELDFENAINILNTIKI